MNDFLMLVLAVLIPNIGGFIGSYYTKSHYRVWYEKLTLPRWKPPKVLPGIIWTFVYIFMGVASYLVWKNGGGFSGPARQPLTMYMIQLLLNFIWPSIFFGAKQMKLATVEIVCLWICIAIMYGMFLPINRIAAYLLVPYLLWVFYASMLTAWITVNNSIKH